MESVTVCLKADRQALEVEAPPIASGVIDFLVFDVQASSEWDGMGSIWVLVSNDGEVCACQVDDGVAVCAAEAVRRPGIVQVALFGAEDAQRMTTQAVIMDVMNSGV